MITYSKARLKIGEVHFKDEAAPESRVDIVRYHSRLEPVERVRCQRRHTILINLEQTEDALFGALNRTTRTQLNRSQRDSLACQVYADPDAQELASFAAFWKQFAPLKNLPPLNMERLEGMRRSSALVLSCAVSESEETLVWHAYVRTREWARLLHSASLYRTSDDKDHVSLVSRANRMLHWHDMKTFRQTGHRTYDFGGWYAGQDDTAKLNINYFKEGFGGEIVPVYYADRGVTLRGTLALELKRLLKRGD